MLLEENEAKTRFMKMSLKMQYLFTNNDYKKQPNVAKYTTVPLILSVCL